MTDIKLDRTFWPVGHGAFYTERFYDCVGKNTFTAIYDCGSGNRWLITKNGERYLSTPEVKDLIEHFTPPQYAQDSKTPIQDIDIAFISHLHADHINGFPVLLPRIKKLVLPQLTDCKLLEAFLYNAFAMSIGDNGEINGGGEVDTESEVQRFITQLAQRSLGENISLIEVTENEGNPSDESIDIAKVQGSINGGSSMRVQIVPYAPIFWIYKPVNVDFSEKKCEQIESRLKQYAQEASIRGDDGEIDWNKVAVAVRKAGLKKIIEIYKEVFEIQNNSSIHNSYSMPVYSGPEDSVAVRRIFAHTDIYMNGLDVHRYMHCRYDVFPHPFRSVRLPLGLQCKLLSCLYMGDFIASDTKKYEQLRRILGMYYDRVGIQQVPHHFSDGNHCAELYRGPLFAFGNVSSYHDKSFKKEVFDDIVRLGCDPLVITQNIHTMVKFEYRLDIY